MKTDPVTFTVATGMSPLSGVVRCVECGRKADLAAPPRSRASDWARWRHKYRASHVDARGRTKGRLVGHVCPRCSDPA